MFLDKTTGSNIYISTFIMTITIFVNLHTHPFPILFTVCSIILVADALRTYKFNGGIFAHSAMTTSDGDQCSTPIFQAVRNNSFSISDLFFWWLIQLKLFYIFSTNNFLIENFQNIRLNLFLQYLSILNVTSIINKFNKPESLSKPEEKLEDSINQDSWFAVFEHNYT